MKLRNKIFNIFIIAIFIASNGYSSFEHDKPSQIRNENVLIEHDDSGNRCSHKDIIQEHICVTCSKFTRNLFLKSNISFNATIEVNFIPFFKNNSYHSLSLNQSPNLRAPPRKS